LSLQQEQRLTKRYPQSTEAYQLFLQGQQQNDPGTPNAARQLFVI
jgi:hypothetical protein